jgi:hypothetical protein
VAISGSPFGSTGRSSTASGVARELSHCESFACIAKFRANLLPEKFAQLFAQPVYRESLSGREEELHDRLGGDLPHPLSLWSHLAHGKQRELVQAEVSDDRAQPLGINVGVARRCRDTLMA